MPFTGGRVAQRESTPFTREGSQVQSLSRPPFPRQGLLRCGLSAMANKTSVKSTKVAKKAAAQRVAAKAAKPAKATPKSRPRKAAKPTLLSGGNPQIAKADGDAPVQAYIAAMPGWKRDVGRRLDALIVRAVPGVRKAVKWNSPFYGVEGQGWFLSYPLLHEVREGGVLPRRVAASRPARRVQAARTCATSTSTRTSARRSSVRRLGEAGEPVARRTNVSATGVQRP